MAVQPGQTVREPHEQTSIPPGERLLVDINPHYTNKIKPGDSQFWNFNMSFQTQRLTVEELGENVRRGYAWTAPHAKVQHTKPNGRLTTYRVKRNVTGVQLLALDSDTEDARSAFTWWLADPFTATHAAFLHTSASHTEDAPRCRIVFALDELLEPGEAELALAAFVWRYPHIDKSCVDASRLFYGAKGCAIAMLANRLPVDVLRAEIIGPYQRHLDAQTAQRQAEREARMARTAFACVPASQADKYVVAAFDKELETLRALTAGTGERHKELLRVATRLASLAAAAWHNVNTANWRAAIIDACVVNGYISAYGEDSVERALETWTSTPPADEPAFAGQFHEGDMVTAVIGKRTITGRIETQRQAFAGGHWESKVNGVWLARSLLQHTQANASLNTDSEPRTTQTKQTQPPPPPPEDPPEDWLTEDWLALACEGDAATTRATQVVKLPPGQYLSDIGLELPQKAILDARTGSGKSTLAIQQPGVVVVACSSVVAVQQLEELHGCGVWYENKKNRQRVTAVTYEGFPGLIKAHQEGGVEKDAIYVFVDESHNFALADYRRPALAKLLDILENANWRGVCVMSGTTIETHIPYFEDFVVVKVDTPQRVQKAQLVRWQHVAPDGAKTGTRRKTAVQLVKRHLDKGERVLVHLNSKSTELDSYVAALIEAGVERTTLYKLNSDTKYESIGQHIVEFETLPDDCRVLFVTDVFVESANLKSDIGAVVVVEPVHPAHLQQLVNRVRGSAPGVVYVLTNGTGHGYGLDVEAELAHTMTAAAALRDKLNLALAVEDEPGVAADSAARRVFGGSYGSGVEFDRHTNTFNPEQIGILQQVHTSVREYAANNPQALKNATRQWNWQWLEDEDLVVTDATTEGEKELANEFAALAQADWLSRVQHVASLEPGTAENELYMEAPPPKLKRVLQRALELETLTGDWGTAVKLLATSKDSTQSYNKVRDMVVADSLREDAFVKALLDAFDVGTPYTQEQRHATLVAVYEQFPHMEPFVTKGYKFSWSAEPRAKLEPGEADRILKLLFTVKDERVRIEGVQVRRWQMTNDSPLDALVALGEELLNGETAVDEGAPANAVLCHQTISFKADNKYGGTGYSSSEAFACAPMTDAQMDRMNAIFGTGENKCWR